MLCCIRRDVFGFRVTRQSQMAKGIILENYRRLVITHKIYVEDDHIETDVHFLIYMQQDNGR